MSDKKNENALQVRDGCAEGVNGEWVINRAHGVSRERMKNDSVCSDESAASCTHRTAVLTIKQPHNYIHISFYDDSHSPEMETVIIWATLLHYRLDMSRVVQHFH